MNASKPNAMTTTKVIRMTARKRSTQSTREVGFASRLVATSVPKITVVESDLNPPRCRTNTRPCPGYKSGAGPMSIQKLLTTIRVGQSRPLCGPVYQGAKEKTTFSIEAAKSAELFCTTVIRCAPQSPKSSHDKVPMMPSYPERLSRYSRTPARSISRLPS